MPSHSCPPSRTAQPAPANLAERPSRSGKRLDPARVAALRELVEGTCWPYRRIAAETGVTAATVSRYVLQKNWRRPPGAAEAARIGTRRERVTKKLWRVAERHADALKDAPLALAQRSLQPLARLTRTLGEMDKPFRLPSPPEPAAPAADRPEGRPLNELRDALQAHLDRIMEEEGHGWEVQEWWFEDGAGI